MALSHFPLKTRPTPVLPLGRFLGTSTLKCNPSSVALRRFTRVDWCREGSLAACLLALRGRLCSLLIILVGVLALVAGPKDNLLRHPDSRTYERLSEPRAQTQLRPPHPNSPAHQLLHTPHIAHDSTTTNLLPYAPNGHSPCPPRRPARQLHPKLAMEATCRQRQSAPFFS